MEPKHFGKFFRCRVGIGFKEWTTMVRLELAIGRIRGENQELANVAIAVGYEEYRTFERAFKKYTGLTPMQHKRAVVAKLSSVA
jgi:two-component system response regulator YesN